MIAREGDSFEVLCKSSAYPQVESIFVLVKINSDFTFVICIFDNRKLATDGFSMEQSWRVWLTTPFSLRRYPGIIGVAFLIVIAFLVVVVVGVVVVAFLVIVDDQT